MSTITVELPEEGLSRLRAMAEELGVSPETLAREGIESLLAGRRERFRRDADYVLEKNEELYRRLAR